MEDKRASSLEARVRDVTASKEAIQSEMQLMRKQLTGALNAKTALDKVINVCNCTARLLAHSLQRQTQDPSQGAQNAGLQAHA